jgi:transcriptional regulator NrdR family protein
MKCPYCGSDDSFVCKTERYESFIMRIRGCKGCGKTFRTDEVVNKAKEG